MEGNELPIISSIYALAIRYESEAMLPLVVKSGDEILCQIHKRTQESMPNTKYLSCISTPFSAGMTSLYEWI
jgi:hypothetical protein